MFIKFNKVSFSYEGINKNIINNLSFHIENGFTAIVGVNGSGKTTIAKLILGELKPENGFIDYSDNGMVKAYCDQECEKPPQNGSELFDLSDHYAGYIKSIFRLGNDYLNRFDTLSFGERKRFQIGCALYLRPDILILDEPTNHIDMECKSILTEAIKTFNGICIIISHDRSFLDSLVNNCIFMREGNITVRSGNYSKCFEDEKHDNEYKLYIYEQSKIKASNLEERYKKLQNESDTKKKTSNSKKNIDKKDHDAKGKIDAARLTGKDRRLASKAKQAKDMYEKSIKDSSSMYFKNTEVLDIQLVGEKAKNEFLFYKDAGELIIGNHHIKYPELVIRSEDRIGLEGYNGSGKTTIIKYILDNMNIPKDKILYIPQEIERAEWYSIFKSIKNLDGKSLGFLMSFIARLGSDPKTVLYSNNHSPGEMRKLILGLGLLKNPYIVILDEPTNHLDMPSIERLEEAISSFEAALALVSHDNVFLNRLIKFKWRFNKTANGSLIEIK